ncbi:MAG: L-threonylcarbamoyladenylate synthase [Fusobacteriota bacterium]
MNLYKPTEKNLQKAGKYLKEGKLVAFPTETVYGLGGDLFNEKSLAKIFKAKDRPSFDPLITHISDLKMLYKLGDIKKGGLVGDIINKFWPGPLTLVLPKKKIVPNLATSGLDTFAVRMPSNEIALKIIENSNGAVAAPSANPFGYLSPTTAEHVREQLEDRVDMIIDGDQCEMGVESTVLDLTKKNPIVLRPGAISVEKLEEVIGKVEIYNRKTKNPTAPGQLPSHYSPRTPLKIFKGEISKEDKNKKIGVLSFKGNDLGINYDKIEILSKKGDMIEAASRLFELLHDLDKSNIDIIYAEQIPEVGIGRAIMDRIYKASIK